MKQTRSALLVVLPAALLLTIVVPQVARGLGGQHARTATVVYVGPMHVPGGVPMVNSGNASTTQQKVTNSAYDQNGGSLFGGSVDPLAPGAMFSSSQFPSPSDTVVWAMVQGDQGKVSGSIEVRPRDGTAPTRLVLGSATILGGSHPAGLGGPVYHLGSDRGIYVNVANIGTSTEMVKVRLLDGGGVVLDSLVMTVDPMHIGTWSPNTSALEAQYAVQVSVDPAATVIASLEEYTLSTGRIEAVTQVS
jgi:hypothetical protein